MGKFQKWYIVREVHRQFEKQAEEGLSWHDVQVVLERAIDENWLSKVAQLGHGKVGTFLNQVVPAIMLAIQGAANTPDAQNTSTHNAPTHQESPWDGSWETQAEKEMEKRRRKSKQSLAVFSGGTPPT